MNNKIILSLCLFLLSACQNKKPILQLSHYIYEFKEAETNKEYTGFSIIKNVGNDTLKILQIDSDCGCTQAFVTKSLLLPEDTCRLNFIYNTQNKKGLQERFICIYANTDSLVHLIKIKAFVH